MCSLFRGTLRSQCSNAHKISVRQRKETQKDSEKQKNEPLMKVKSIRDNMLFKY